LDSEEVKALSRKAGESLMEMGYIPESTIQQVNQWLDDYRINKSKEMVDVPG
jgi:hypothetical protein